MIKRVKTGITGFDKLIEGGIPRGFNVLLSGSTGTGKTIFGLTFLYNGVKKYKENGLYITFEESRENLYIQAKRLGMNIKSMVENNNIVIRSIPEEATNNTLNIIQSINQTIKDYKIKRIVFDSIDTYINSKICSDTNAHFHYPMLARHTIYQLIKTFQGFPQTTKILISEVEEESSKLSKEGAPEDLCDGVIKIDFDTLGQKYSRHIKVRKMRATNNNNDLFPLEINNKGIIVHNN